MVIKFKHAGILIFLYFEGGKSIKWYNNRNTPKSNQKSQKDKKIHNLLISIA